MLGSGTQAESEQPIFLRLHQMLRCMASEVSEHENLPQFKWDVEDTTNLYGKRTLKERR